MKLIGPAFTIALLDAIESLLSAVVADGMANTRHDSNQELIGQGIANVLSPPPAPSRVLPRMSAMAAAVHLPVSCMR